MEKRHHGSHRKDNDHHGSRQRHQGSDAQSTDGHNSHQNMKHRNTHHNSNVAHKRTLHHRHEPGHATSGKSHNAHSEHRPRRDISSPDDFYIDENQKTKQVHPVVLSKDFEIEVDAVDDDKKYKADLELERHNSKCLKLNIDARYNDAFLKSIDPL